MFFKSSDFLFLEFSDSRLKLLWARRKHSLLLPVSLAAIELPPDSDRQYDQILRKSLPLREVRGENVFVVIPRRAFFMKHFSLPAQGIEEMSKMVDLQIGQHIPYPKEEVIVDISVLGTGYDGLMKAVVMAVPKQVVARQLQVFRGVGFSCSRLVPGSRMVIRRLPRPVVDLLPRGECAMIIDVDEQSSEICFFQDSKLVFSRSIDYGARDLVGAGFEDYTGQVAVTVAAYYRERMGEALHKAFIIMEPSNSPALRDWLAEHLSLSVQVIAPFSGFSVDKEPFKSVSEKHRGVSFSSLLGFLSGPAQEFTFLVPVDDIGSRPQPGKNFFQCAALGVLAVLLAVAIGAVQINKKDAYLQDIQRKYAQVKKEALLTQARGKEIASVREKMNSRIFVADLMSDVFRSAPAGISFTKVWIDEQHQLVAEGSGSNAAIVDQFRDQFMEAGIGDDVVLRSSEKEGAADNESVSFQLTCHIADKISGKSREK